MESCPLLPGSEGKADLRIDVAERPREKPKSDCVRQTEKAAQQMRALPTLDVGFH
jgi:hypothetical protein